MIEIIPAIDIIDGKCVRLTQGDFDRKTVYSEDPLEAAKRFEAAGMKRLHMVDLDGARSGKPANLHILERVAGRTDLRIDFGGGINSEPDLGAVFDSGAAIANIGSLAVKQPDRFLSWIDKYGRRSILLGADARDGNIAINGWQTSTRISIFDLLAEFAEKGVMSAFVTDIGRDGAMSGPSIELYQQIIRSVPDLELIASGGVRSISDVDHLQRIGCSGVIIGKAIYEKSIGLEELSRYVG